MIDTTYGASRRFVQTTSFWKSLLCCSLFAAGLGAQTNQSDPIGGPGHLNLFPDDELITMSSDGAGGPSNSNVIRSFVTDSSPSLPLNAVNFSSNLGVNQSGYVAAAGRVVESSSDTAVWVSREYGTSNLQAQIAYVDPVAGYATGVFLVGSGLADLNPKSGFDVRAVAVGDLDQVADANGNYHDEIAVAYQTSDVLYGPVQLQLVVMNFGKGTNAVQWTTIPVTVPDTPANHSSDVPISVAIGDFDGNGNNEVAIGYAGAKGVDMLIYKYTTDGQGEGTLQLLSSTSIPPVSGTTMQQALSMKADDFVGGGRSQLAIAYFVSTPGPNSTTQAQPVLEVVSFNSALQATMSNPLILSGYASTRGLAFGRVQLATGQFLFGPPSIPFGQHQLALAWSQQPDVNYPYTIRVQGFTVSSDLSSIIQMGSGVTVTGAWPSDFSLVAGGFAGNSNIQSPTASLALSYFSFAGLQETYRAETITIGSTFNLSVSNSWSTVTGGTNELPMVAADLSGKSLYLGAPVVITATGAVRPQYLIQQPPSHAYWCKTGNTNCQTGPAIENVSRGLGTTTFAQSSSSGSVASTTTTSSQTYAGSSSVTASASLKAGGNFGMASASATLSASVTEGTSYQNQNNNSAYSSSAQQFDLSSSAVTNYDDWVKYNSETFYIWRYRLYGVAQQNSLNTFYELVLPGPGGVTYGGGLDADWYQPVHEVGNILSYPEYFGYDSGSNTYNYTPWDVGNVTPAGSNESTSGLLVPDSTTTFSGTQDTNSLSYSNSVSSSNTFSSSNTLGNNSDMKASFSATAGAFGSSISAGVSGDVSFNSSNSWGQANTGTNTLSTDTTMAVSVAPGLDSESYSFHSVVYSATDGTLKVDFAVPNPGLGSDSGQPFWATLYGGLPDPALSLPLRFRSPAGNPAWTVETTNLRKRMQSLFFRSSDINPASNDYDYLNEIVTAGTNVRLEARVYNYSTATQTSPITVQFEAIQYDSELDNEICRTQPVNGSPSDNTGRVCPQADRTPIGTYNITSLGALQFTCLAGTDDPLPGNPSSTTPPNVTGCNQNSAFVNWPTSGLGGASAGSANTYRIYVVLNPTVTGLGPEIPGAPGAENYTSEGPPVAITNISNTTPLVVTTAAPHGLQDGYYVTIGQVNGLTEANGAWQVTVLSPTTFKLNNTVPGQNPYSGGGTATLLDPGQNNEGYGVDELSIQSPPSGLQSKPSSPPDDYLMPDSVEAVDRRTGHLVKNSVTAYQNRPLRVRVKIFSSAAHRAGARLRVFDGNPAAGGHMIVDRLVHPGNEGPKGTGVWFTWQPKQPGMHKLYAELIEGAHDPHKQNNVASLNVEVEATGDVNGDGKVNSADLQIITANIGKWANESACGPACDLDDDNVITVLDVRKLILVCGDACDSKTANRTALGGTIDEK